MLPLLLLGSIPNYSKGYTKSKTHNNSSLSTKDTNIQGVNIDGSKSTILNVGGNLNVESVQDSYTKKDINIDGLIQ